MKNTSFQQAQLVLDAHLRERMISPITEFKNHSSKKFGLATGTVYQDSNTDSLHMLKVMPKMLSGKSFGNFSKDSREEWDIIRELIAHHIYKTCFLYSRTPFVGLVDATDDSVALKSRYLRGTTLFEFSNPLQDSEGKMRLNHHSDMLRTISGFEEILAAAIVIGDYDFHSKNIIVNDSIAYRIDHGRAFFNILDGKFLDDFQYFTRYIKRFYEDAIFADTVLIDISLLTEHLNKMINIISLDNLKSAIIIQLHALKMAGVQVDSPEDHLVKFSDVKAHIDQNTLNRLKIRISEFLDNGVKIEAFKGLALDTPECIAHDTKNNLLNAGVRPADKKVIITEERFPFFKSELRDVSITMRSVSHKHSIMKALDDCYVSIKELKRCGIDVEKLGLPTVGIQSLELNKLTKRFEAHLEYLKNFALQLTIMSKYGQNQVLQSGGWIFAFDDYLSTDLDQYEDIKQIDALLLAIDQNIQIESLDPIIWANRNNVTILSSYNVNLFWAIVQSNQYTIDIQELAYNAYYGFLRSQNESTLTVLRVLIEKNHAFVPCFINAYSKCDELERKVFDGFIQSHPKFNLLFLSNLLTMCITTENSDEKELLTDAYKRWQSFYVQTDKLITAERIKVPSLEAPVLATQMSMMRRTTYQSGFYETSKLALKAISHCDIKLLLSLCTVLPNMQKYNTNFSDISNDQLVQLGEGLANLNILLMCYSQEKNAFKSILVKPTQEIADFLDYYINHCCKYNSTIPLCLER